MNAAGRAFAPPAPCPRFFQWPTESAADHMEGQTVSDENFARAFGAVEQQLKNISEKLTGVQESMEAATRARAVSDSRLAALSTSVDALAFRVEQVEADLSALRDSATHTERTFLASLAGLRERWVSLTAALAVIAAIWAAMARTDLAALGAALKAAGLGK